MTRKAVVVLDGQTTEVEVYVGPGSALPGHGRPVLALPSGGSKVPRAEAAS